MSGTVIAARGLRKHYGKLAAVDGIDLAVGSGEIFGLLGPNGAGKTTTILMLLGLTDPTAGEIAVHGVDPRRAPLEVKRHVGYLPDSIGFYDHLTARENLRYTARLAGIARGEVEERIAAALARVRLSEAADRKVAGFSRGMRQRLGLAEVLMKRVEVAILDEPTSGLDPQATFELLDMIRGLKSDGIAVLISSHLLDRVQAVCDRVALFHRGRIALQGTVAELAREVLGGGYAIEVEVRDADPSKHLGKVPGVRRVEKESATRFRILADRDVRAAVARAIVEGGGELLALNTVEPSLERVYRHYFEGAHGQA